MLRNQLRDRRGQIRGIDFTMAVFFFVIVLGQLIIVILNANILIISQKKTEATQNEIDQLAAKLFGSEGSPADWGDLNASQPTSLGLAVQELASTGFELDARKLARLNVEAARISDYTRTGISYETIHDLLGLGDNVQFHLTIRSALSIDVNPGDHVIGVNVLFLDQEPVEDVTLNLFAANLANGILVSLATASTNSTGGETLDYTGINLDFPHALIVVGQKGAFWGINHFIPDRDYNIGISFGNGNSELFLSQNATYSGSGIGLSDFGSSTQNHTFSYIYTNSSSLTELSYSIPGTDGHTRGPFLQTSFNFGAVGIIIGIVCIRADNAYQYRVGTIPALLDRSEGNSGIFPEIGPTVPDTDTKSTASSRYLLTVRQTMLVAELTLWEEL